jgi:hypothetical protein
MWRAAMKSVKGTTLLSSKTHRTRMARRRFKSGSSCGQDSAALDCPTSLSSRILLLAWRLVCLRRQGSRTMWHASAWPKSSRSWGPPRKR